MASGVSNLKYQAGALQPRNRDMDRVVARGWRGWRGGGRITTAALLLVRADPRKTIQAYREIAKVILGGRVLDPSELAANRP